MSFNTIVRLIYEFEDLWIVMIMITFADNKNIEYSDVELYFFNGVKLYNVKS